MKTVQSLSARTFIMMISTVLLNAIAIITAPIFTRILTTEDFGIYSLYVSWIAILANICGLQTNGTLNNAKVDFKDWEYKSYCINCFLLSTIACIVWSGIWLVFNTQLSKWSGIPKECIIWLVVGTYGTCLVCFLNSYFLIEKKVIANLVISVVIALTTTIGSILLIMYSQMQGYYARVFSYGVVYLIASLGIIIYFLRLQKTTINLTYWKYCLNLSLPLVVHSLSGRLLDQSDRIMLMSSKGESIVGIYSFCYTMALPIAVLSSAVNSAWTPTYYELMSKDSKKEINNHYNRQMFLITGICCGYILVVPEILKILSVKEYWEGIGIVPIVIAGYFFNFLYFFPVNYEFFNKQTKYIAISTVGAAIINIVLNYILIPKWGMYGAAFATIIAYVLLFLIHDFIARRIIKGYDIKWRFYLKGIIPILITVIISSKISHSVVIRWGIGFVIGIAILYKLKKQNSLI